MSYLFLSKFNSKRGKSKWEFIVYSDLRLRPKQKYLGELKEFTNYGYLLKNGRKIFLERKQSTDSN